jgi:hypothetical protein
VVPDYLSTATKHPAYFENKINDFIRNAVGAPVGSRANGWYTPTVPMEMFCLLSGWPVVVFFLDMTVEFIPFTLPAPDSATVNAAFVGDDLQWQALNKQQFKSGCSSARQVRIGRIGHGRLLSA